MKVVEPQAGHSVRSAIAANPRLGQLWLNALASECGAAASTLQTYRDDLACYFRWLSRQHHGIALAEITREHIRAYLAHLDAEHAYAEATVGRGRSVVRALHRFLITEGLATQDPMLDVAPMTRPKRLPYTPSISDVDRLLDTAHAWAADPSVGLYRQAGYARRAALFDVQDRPGSGDSSCSQSASIGVGQQVRSWAGVGRQQCRSTSLALACPARG
jgi:hypothetical protein